MESWSLCDDNEDITGTYLDMRDEPMMSPANSLYNTSQNISKMNLSTVGSFEQGGANENSVGRSASKTPQQSVTSPSSGKGFRFSELLRADEKVKTSEIMKTTTIFDI